MEAFVVIAQMALCRMEWEAVLVDTTAAVLAIALSAIQSMDAVSVPPVTHLPMPQPAQESAATAFGFL